MSRVFGAALRGVDGVPVEVEVRISSQLPRIDVVGLPEAAVRESAARVRAAIASIGRPFPSRRVTVNLAPAGLRKSGAGLDLPIAIGILAAAGAIEESADFLLGLYRPDLHAEDSQITVQILKNRKGQHGVEFSYRFDKKSLRIVQPTLQVMRHEF